MTPSYQDVTPSYPDGETPYVLAEVPAKTRSARLTVPRGRIGWWIVESFDCGDVQSNIWFFDHTVGPEPPVILKNPPRKRSVGRPWYP